MKQHNEEFEFESLQDTKSIARYLVALKDGFMDGRIVLGSPEKQIVFAPSGLLKLEVKAKKKHDRVKISLKCSWKEENPVRRAKNDSLVIGAGK
ncbi:MAG: amphi-Trp domain-containing protein [Spirochaetia bacterium]|nr:amphi-Trp domain-containing protein [Spirochaetia bacterium]